MMKIRLLFFLVAVCVALFLPFWFLVPVVFFYALIFTPYELLIFAVLLDAQFGEVGVGMWYLYTLTVAVILVVTFYSKPHLRFY